MTCSFLYHPLQDVSCCHRLGRGNQSPSQACCCPRGVTKVPLQGLSISPAEHLSGFVSCVCPTGSLTDSAGHILIPGIYDHVAPLTEEEKELYGAIDLDLEEYLTSSRVKKFLFHTKVQPPAESSLKGMTTLNHFSHCLICMLLISTS